MPRPYARSAGGNILNMNSYSYQTGRAPGDVLSDLLAVSPGWMEEMRIPFLDGRDFRREETYPNVAIVNQAFANQFFRGEDPVGKRFEMAASSGERSIFEIVYFVSPA